MLAKKTLVIGDLHLGRLAYSEYIKDNRIKEKNEIFNFIVKQSKNVDNVVLLGDNFNTKTPSAETVKDFTKLIERFENKRVFILSGNHEVNANGKTPIDYLKEIKNKNWKIITNEVYSEDGMVFCPFFSSTFLGAENNKDAINKIMAMLPDGEMLFTHLAITGCKTISGQLVDDFVEPVLPKEELLKKYKRVFAGHIHHHGIYDNIVLSGSVFNNEVGETQKYIWKIDETNAPEKIALPGRKIMKLENPKQEELDKLENDSIVKVIISKEHTGSEILELKEFLGEKFSENGAYLIVERIEKKRTRAHYGKGESVADMSIDDLLKVYSEQKNIDLSKLKLGFQLITDESNKTTNREDNKGLYE